MKFFISERLVGVPVLFTRISKTKITAIDHKSIRLDRPLAHIIKEMDYLPVNQNFLMVVFFDQSRPLSDVKDALYNADGGSDRLVGAVYDSWMGLDSPYPYSSRMEATLRFFHSADPVPRTHFVVQQWLSESDAETQEAMTAIRDQTYTHPDDFKGFIIRAAYLFEDKKNWAISYMRN